MDFDKIVKKLSKRREALLDMADLCALAAPGAAVPGKKERAAAHKLAYRLTSSGVLARVRRGLWTVAVAAGPAGKPSAPADPDAAYWGLLRKAATAAYGRDWMVGGAKALELHLRDVSAPAAVRVLCAGPSATKVLLPGRKARFHAPRGYASIPGKTLFPKLRPHAVATVAEGVRIPVARVELALLEYLSAPARERDGHLLARALRKFGPSLSRDALGALASLRYIVALNRLKAAAKSLGFPAVYALCLDVVKREGRGRFLST